MSPFGGEFIACGDGHIEEQIDCGRPPSFKDFGSYLTGVVSWFIMYPLLGCGFTGVFVIS